VFWVRAFIRHHGLRHPRDLDGADVESFLTWLAGERQVASATHRQALSVLLFLYGKVLGVELPWMSETGRPRPQRRLPVPQISHWRATANSRHPDCELQLSIRGLRSPLRPEFTVHCTKQLSSSLANRRLRQFVLKIDWSASADYACCTPPKLHQRHQAPLGLAPLEQGPACELSLLGE